MTHKSEVTVKLRHCLKVTGIVTKIRKILQCIQVKKIHHAEKKKENNLSLMLKVKCYLNCPAYKFSAVKKHKLKASHFIQFF